MKFQHRNSLQRRCLNAQPAKNDLMLLPEQKFWRLKAFFSLATVNQKQQKTSSFQKSWKFLPKNLFFLVTGRVNQLLKIWPNQNWAQLTWRMAPKLKSRSLNNKRGSKRKKNNQKPARVKPAIKLCTVWWSSSFLFPWLGLLLISPFDSVTISFWTHQSPCHHWRLFRVLWAWALS